MQDANPEDEWVSLDEAAAHLGINRRTVNEWRRLRGLPAHRLGYKTIVYNRDELDAWARDHGSELLRRWPSRSRAVRKANGPPEGDPVTHGTPTAKRGDPSWAS